MENLEQQNPNISTSSEESRTEKINSFFDTDGKDLISIARNILIILGLIIIISGILLGFRDKLSINLMWACMIAGILGSTSSALMSALQRKANGWETEDGITHPVDGKSDMFSQRMATFFLYRPVFGIIAGLLIFFGIEAEYFGNINSTEEAKVVFLSIISGLFIKSLIEKLKDLFDNLIGIK